MLGLNCVIELKISFEFFSEMWQMDFFFFEMGIFIQLN